MEHRELRRGKQEAGGDISYAEVAKREYLQDNYIYFIDYLEIHMAPIVSGFQYTNNMTLPGKASPTTNT
jgi:hypothetical protein